jgi:SAM-dependent methyltransferase
LRHDGGCVVCGGTRRLPLYPDISVFRCGDCGHVFFGDAGPAGGLARLYGERYFTRGEYFDYGGERKVHALNAARRLRTVRRFAASGRLLEIGCAHGFFLDLARPGFDVLGVEISEFAAGFARTAFGLDVRAGDFLDMDVGGGWDAVCLYDCVEHLPRPDLVLLKAAALMPRGAHLFLTTGDLGALVPRLRGRKWRLMHPPTHLHFFSRKTLARLLDRCGFDVLSVAHPGTWRSAAIVAAQVLGAPGLARWTPGRFWMNLGDIMEVVARRR